MAQHTPGPWKATTGNGRPVVRCGPNTIASIGTGRLADARLIAAAPEMYALLRNAVNDAAGLDVAHTRDLLAHIEED